MKILCIGHITRDKIVTPQLTQYMAGGTTTYVALGLSSILQSVVSDKASAIDFRLIASLAPADSEIVTGIRSAGISVEVIPSVETMFFENIYGAESSDRRQNVRSIGDPFSIAKLRPFIEPLRHEQHRPYIILGSLLAEDFPLDVVNYCNEVGKVVMDAQGYFREVRYIEQENGERLGKVFECEWKDKDQFLSKIDVLKLNENEAKLITNEDDLHRAAQILHDNGVKEVLLTLGRQGSIIAADGQVMDIPVVPETETIDATGCGDTYVMAYIYRRSLGFSPYESGLFASSAATFKLEGTGPLQATEEAIIARIVR